MRNGDEHQDITSHVLTLDTEEAYERELAALEAAGIPHQPLGDRSGGWQHTHSDAPPQRRQWRIVVYQTLSESE